LLKVGGAVKPEAVKVWFEQHRHDKNYQYRGLTETEFNDRAKTAFARMTEDQRAKVLKVCKKYDLINVQEIANYRFLSQTNLFALCKLLEKYKDMSDKEYVWKDGTVHTVHESICNEFFVRKDPTYATFKAFALTYADLKERLLLVPRGGFKSSMNMADCVQWIICYPEVTIMVLTGVLDLANDFVGEIKGHFELEENPNQSDIFGKKSLRPRTMPDGTPSWFQILFPEHCVEKEIGKANEFQTPACATPDKECTVFAASIEQNLVGWHVGIMKLDDVVTNENSQTADRIKNINKQVSINQAMLNPGGFYDKIGTWYDGSDTYGEDIKNKAKFEADGDVFPMKIYIRPCWWLNEAATAAGKIEEEATEQDYVLWFDEPMQLNYEFLRKKKKSDPYFAIKYLNDPLQMNVIKFPRSLLIRHTINGNDLPDTGMIVTVVDTAYSTKNWADYTVIITALIYNGRFYVIDMNRGRFNEYELPAMVAAAGLKWKPKRISIEETGAIKYVQREVYREMEKLKIRIPVELVPLGKGDKKVNSKQKKAGPLLRYLGLDRFKFVNICPGLEEIYTELEKFGTASSVHDDIVDALAILVNQYAGYADIEGQQTAANTSYVPDTKLKNYYDQVHCLGKFSKMKQDVALEFPDANASQVAQAVKDELSYYDPLADLLQ
jgi:phage terminase large subunit-like protein